MHAPTLQRALRHLTLAVALAGAAAAAAAAPGYHVEIDTSRFSGAGFLDFVFIPGNSGAPAASATLRHVSGAFGGVVAQEGDVSGAVGGVLSLRNGGFYNGLFQSIALGGQFSFDVEFGGAFQFADGGAGSTFGVGLLDASGARYLGNPGGNVVQFELMPAFGGAPAGVSGAVYGGVATIAAVPEPGAWLMLSAGLALLGWGARRRRGVEARAA
ncbi:hypothetical protein ACFDR9_004801 [Janthinobacterium sp. CG_23.3]|uniref:NF038129 family PEP-CTERM protein n=1 Tax=Janthinobacterium sp. CG_23.3 TaxID=3349634 RepID=UPI0038D3BAFE